MWLREQIAGGAFSPGMQLRQEALAAQCGVSVPPVREALKTLEAEGQVVYSPHRGYFVASLSYPELVENYRIRELLETEAIRRSVPSLSRADLSRMQEAIRDMEAAHRATDLTALTVANRRFHFTLFEAPEMPRTADFIRILWDNTERYRSLYFAAQENRKRVNAEHRAIMTAVRAHDSETAVKLLRTHRENAQVALQAGLEGPPVAGASTRLQR